MYNNVLLLLLLLVVVVVVILVTFYQFELLFLDSFYFLLTF